MSDGGLLRELPVGAHPGTTAGQDELIDLLWPGAPATARAAWPGRPPRSPRRAGSAGWSGGRGQVLIGG